MSNKKNVFLFLSRLDRGGQEAMASRISEMLHNQYEIYIVLFDSKTINYPVFGTILTIGYSEETHTIIKKVIKTIKRSIKFRKLLKTYNPIACISFGQVPDLINTLCKQRTTKVVTSIRGFATAERITKDVVSKILYRRSDQIICVSDGIRVKLEKDMPFLSDKLSVIYNAYDCDKIMLEATQGAHMIDIGKGKEPRIVSIGTLRPEKGFWHLIKAVYVLKDKYPNIHLSIVGPDYKDNGNKLQLLIDSLNMAKNVTLEGWHSNPHAFTQNATLYVLSSISEGFPNALVEAMACGKAVIAADCLTGPREILCQNCNIVSSKSIEYAEYGILVPSLEKCEDYTQNISERERLLAKAIDVIVSDNQLRKTYEKKAIERAREFSYEKCKSDIIAILGGNQL